MSEDQERWPETGKASHMHLMAMQRMANHSLVISVTRRCPLQCSHCIVSSGPDADSNILNESQAILIARQLPALKNNGLLHITFTGGEPVMALKAVKIIAQAAFECGINTAIVTSAAWAVSEKAANNIIQALLCITNWDLGFDTFHQQQMGLGRFKLAIGLLEENKRNFSVRMCVSDPPTNEEEELYHTVRALVPGDHLLIRQNVRSIGRASSFRGHKGKELGDVFHLLNSPCVSSGPFLREDGSVGPCCSGMAYYTKGKQPFHYGEVLKSNQPGDLSAAMTKWNEDPLLRIIRLTGFYFPLRWIFESGMDYLLPDTLPHNTCELCTNFWDREGKIEAFLREKLSSLETQKELEDAFELLKD